MKVQLKGIDFDMIQMIYNNISKIVYYTINGNSRELKYKQIYFTKSINKFLSEHEEFKNNSAQYCLYTDWDNHRYVVVYMYDAGSLEAAINSEIMVKESNVVFEGDLAVDFIFLPRELLLESDIKVIYTAIFVLFHLTLELLSDLSKDDMIRNINLTSVASLFAASLVDDSLFFVDDCPLTEFKDIVKKYVDQLWFDDTIITGEIPHIVTAFDNLSNLLNDYLHEIHLKNNVRDYE